MTEGLFRSLLRRSFIVPVATLALIALTLGIAVRRLQTSARLVDHTDQVIAHANLLNRLIIDQETGIRGYAAYKSPIFLDPYTKAKPAIEREFNVLHGLVSDNSDQIEALTKLRSSYGDWLIAAELEIHGARDTSTAEQRKQMMDEIRRQLDSFSSTEMSLRGSRDATLGRAGRYSFLIGFAAIGAGALLIGLYTVSNLKRLTYAYDRQLDEVKKQRAEAIENEAWLRTTLKSIGDAVIACDADGRVVFMNLVGERLTGWLSVEAKGKALHEVFRIVNETSRAVVESPVEKVRRLGIVVGLANHTILIRRDGKEFNIDDSGAPIVNERGEVVGIVLIFRDITERHQAEAALVRAERLASAGRLSAAIAHEVNNPLEALTNLLYLTKTELPQSVAREYIEQAESEVSRIAHITRQSLGFHHDEKSISLYSAAGVINQAVSFYSARATIKSVKLTTEIRGDIELMGSSGELRQILSNLISNAMDACGPGGSIRVNLRKSQEAATGRVGAMITVADSGCGIIAEKREAIFEPFYTTKGSTGTGLGLWVTKQLIERQGGVIRLRSSIEGRRRGTAFRIFLPAVGSELSDASVLTGEGFLSVRPSAS
jgi:PAS domain S-box-containing protein